MGQKFQLKKCFLNLQLLVRCWDKKFYCFSIGERVENPKYLKNSLKRLKVLQKRVSRKQNGSKNREKAKQKLAILHEKITNQKNNFQHKFSFKLVSEN